MPKTDGFSRRAEWAGGEPITSIVMAKTLAHPELVSLAAGFVDYDSLPLDITQQALEHIWAEPGRVRSALQYGTTIGHSALRDAILQRMLEADGCTAEELNVSTSQVVITSGSNQLLYHLGNVLLDPGDIVLCAAPSYFVFLGVLSSLGARAVGVESDQHGPIPDAINQELTRLEAAGELGRVKAIYITSYYDNPTGATVSTARREAIVELAKRWSRSRPLYIIEDTAYRELRYSGDDPPSMRSLDPQGETVISAGTFSKSFSPGIRVGWGILPPGLVEPILSEKGHFDFGSANFNQTLMAAVFELGLFEPHLEQLRVAYRRKVDAALAAADEFLQPIEGVDWIHPGGGLYVWVRLPQGLDAGLSGRLFDTAVDEGVLYVPGEYCYPPEGRPTRKNRLRLSFGVPSCESVRRGVQSLAKAIGKVME